MNLAQTTDLYSLFQSHDEAVAVETAVHTAVISIMKVFLDLSDKRAKSYQVKLAEVEEQNMQLQLKLQATERQLHILQHTSSPEEISSDLTSSQSSQSLSTELNREKTALPSENTLEACLEPSGKLYKEEPAYEDTFWIKNEIAEENAVVDFDYHVARIVSVQAPQTLPIQRCGAYNSLNHSVQEDDTVLTNLEKRRLLSNERVRQYRARIRADPEKYLIWKEKDRLRYLRRRKSISDLSEPMKNLKRMAWREASKRHRARKLAQVAFTHT